MEPYISIILAVIGGAALGAVIYHQQFCKEDKLKKELLASRVLRANEQETAAAHITDLSQQIKEHEESVKVDNAEHVVDDAEILSLRVTIAEQLDKIQLADKIFMQAHRELKAGQQGIHVSVSTPYMTKVMNLIKTEWREMV